MVKEIFAGLFVGGAIGILPLCAMEPSLAKGDSAFLAMAAQADMTMAHVGQMAEERAATHPVKDFGKTLADDHTSDYHELSKLSSKVGDAIPKAISKQNDREIQSLEHLRGRIFDKEFLKRQVAEHERLVKAFKDEADHGRNIEVKAYANKALPVVERHLHEVEDLTKSSASKG